MLLYASYISVPEDLERFFDSIKEQPRNIDINCITKLQYDYFRRQDFISLNLYHFHMLVFCTKIQNHPFSHLNEDFFNKLSPYKDKLRIGFKTVDGSWMPSSLNYYTPPNKINIDIKKKLIKIFRDSNIIITENKSKRVNRKTKEVKSFITSFTFE